MRTLNRISRVSHLPQSHRGAPHPIRRCIYPLRNTIDGAAPSLLPFLPRFNHPGISLRLDDREILEIRRSRLLTCILSNVILALPKNSYKRAPSS
jgi:hypothetical protein